MDPTGNALNRPIVPDPGSDKQPLRWHRRPGRTLFAYTAREALRPFLFALIGLTAAVAWWAFEKGDS